MQKPSDMSATLESQDASRFEMGWPARDARQRVARSGEEEWLPVRGRVTCAVGSWEFLDEALTEDEALMLAERLSVRPWPRNDIIAFVEPCLTFYLAGAVGDLLNVGIRFRGEVAPPWIHAGGLAWDEGFRLDLRVSESGIARFAEWLRRSITGGR